eukprot:SAG22_NODE_18040_length_294_cov_0.800000_2_plen_41_part_01
MRAQFNKFRSLRSVCPTVIHAEPPPAQLVQDWHDPSVRQHA